jgi:hypothetical protein
MDPSKTAQTTQQHDDTNQQVSCVPLINDTYPAVWITDTAYLF